MRYSQYRFVKRKGEIVQQHRYCTVTTRMAYPWWMIWKSHIYVADREYTEWTDMPMEEIE